jgi:hypothetical protein
LWYKPDSDSRYISNIQRGPQHLHSRSRGGGQNQACLERESQNIDTPIAREQFHSLCIPALARVRGRSHAARWQGYNLTPSPASNCVAAGHRAKCIKSTTRSVRSSMPTGRRLTREYRGELAGEGEEAPSIALQPLPSRPVASGRALGARLVGMTHRYGQLLQRVERVERVLMNLPPREDGVNQDHLPALGNVPAASSTLSPPSHTTRSPVSGDITLDRAKIQQDVVGMIEAHRKRGKNVPAVWHLVETWTQTALCNNKSSTNCAEAKDCTKLSSNTAEDGEICAICLGSLASACGEEKPAPSRLTMPCSHWFHASCLVPWLITNNTCPVCRAAIEPTCYHCRRKALSLQPWRWPDLRPPTQQEARGKEEHEAALVGLQGLLTALGAAAATGVEGEDSSGAALRGESAGRGSDANTPAGTRVGQGVSSSQGLWGSEGGSASAASRSEQRQGALRADEAAGEEGGGGLGTATSMVEPLLQQVPFSRSFPAFYSSMCAHVFACVCACVRTDATAW